MTRYEVHALDRDSWVIVDTEDGTELDAHGAHRLAESLVETGTHAASRVVLVRVAS